jgi:hypothetical protein
MDNESGFAQTWGEASFMAHGELIDAHGAVMRLPERLSFAEWRQVGLSVTDLEKKSRLWLLDVVMWPDSRWRQWLDDPDYIQANGSQPDGAPLIEELAEWLQLAPQTILNARHAAKVFPPETRVFDPRYITFSWYKAAAEPGGLSLQERLLELFQAELGLKRNDGWYRLPPGAPPEAETTRVTLEAMRARLKLRQGAFSGPPAPDSAPPDAMHIYPTRVKHALVSAQDLFATPLLVEMFGVAWLGELAARGAAIVLEVKCYVRDAPGKPLDEDDEA